MTEPTVHLYCCIGARTSPELVRQFVAHYRNLGIRSWWIFLNFEVPDEHHASAIRDVLASVGLLAMPWPGIYCEVEALVRRQELVDRQCQSGGDWIVDVDVDEFVRFPAPVAAYLAQAEARGVDWIPGAFVDRVAEQGRLKTIEAAPLARQFPLGCHFTRDVLKAPDRKVVAAKSRVGILPGHHGVMGNHVSGDEVLAVDHYKWDDSVAARMAARVALMRQGATAIDFSAEYERALRHIVAFGRLDLTLTESYRIFS